MFSQYLMVVGFFVLSFSSNGQVINEPVPQRKLSNGVTVVRTNGYEFGRPTNGDRVAPAEEPIEEWTLTKCENKLEEVNSKIDALNGQEGDDLNAYLDLKARIENRIKTLTDDNN